MSTILAIVAIVLIVAILIFFNALYVAGEFSAVSARKTRISQMADEENRLARLILPVLEDPERLDNYIAASQVGITLSSITLGIYGQDTIAPLLTPWLARLPLSGLGDAAGEVAAAGIAATLVLILLTVLQVILGELLPKSVALQYPERVALLTAVPMKWSAEIILRPLIVFLNGSGRLLLRLLGTEAHGEHAHVHSPEEIVILVKESATSGLLDAEERQLLRNVFRVSETKAGEVAIPRPRMVATDVEKPLGEIVKLAAESAYTRIPLYENDIDHIVGYVHLKELFGLYHSKSGADVRTILRKVPYVPETLKTLEVWNRLNEEDSYLAIVFDEYGGTSGMLTREDLIEELFGELQDEFDQERALIAPTGDGRLIVRGDMPITRLNELFELNLPHEDVHTIGGLVLDKVGGVPSVGAVLQVEGVRLRVEAVANTVVTSVSLTPPAGAIEELLDLSKREEDEGAEQ